MRDRLRRRPLLFTVLGAALLAAGGASAEYVRVRYTRITPATVAPLVAERLAADSLALHRGTHAVYRARQALPLWFTAGDRAAALEALRSAEADALPLDAALAGLEAVADTARTPRARADLDVALTDALLRFGEALVRPRVDARELYGINWAPAPPAPPDVGARLVEALAAHPESPAAGLEAWANGLRPPHPGYRRLRAALARELGLRDLAPLEADAAPGDSSAAVEALRARLAVEGLDAPPEAAPSVFDAALGAALRGWQRGRGLGATGRLDTATRGALNERNPELIPLLQLNLEKWRWLPADLGALHVWVNVPRFELAVRERAGDDWAEVTRFVTVVGARDWQTPAFTDTLESVVFNPTWIVPASIQRESYGYVKGFVERGPGPGNAMGRVKFLFPNDHAVYVHDTPTKWAFGVDDRARSHGCVRAGDPEALARALLPRTNGWTESEVSAVFRGPWWPTRHVQVEGTVPVHLVYFTAEAEPDGRVVVHDDVYARDRRLAEALGLELPELRPELRATLLADRIGDEEQVRAALEADAPEDAVEAPADTAGAGGERPLAPSDSADARPAGVLSESARR